MRIGSRSKLPGSLSAGEGRGRRRRRRRRRRRFGVHLFLTVYVRRVVDFEIVSLEKLCLKQGKTNSKAVAVSSVRGGPCARSFASGLVVKGFCRPLLNLSECLLSVRLQPYPRQHEISLCPRASRILDPPNRLACAHYP